MSSGDGIAVMLRRRRLAALRCEPLSEEYGMSGRDPWAPRKREPEPSTFGLTTPELVAEARRLWAWGWRLDEITTVLAIPVSIDAGMGAA